MHRTGRANGGNVARFYYGGQAVIEGVMMRGPRDVAVAVRKPDASIVVRREPLPRPYGHRLFRLPFLRGLILLSDMLFLGTRMLIFSAEVSVSTDEAPIELSGGAAGITLAISLCFSIGLFFVLPLLAAQSMGRLVSNALLNNLLEGVIRLALLLGYLALIGRVGQIRRVFAYHGAEHKTINALEAHAPLDPAHIRPFPLANPRCGTGFLLVVVVLCVVVFAALGQPPILLRLLSRIVLVPVVATVAYELIRFAADHYGNPIVHALMAPSIALQGLTTSEPDDAQLEVAIAALRAVLAPEPAVATPSAGVAELPAVAGAASS